MNQIQGTIVKYLTQPKKNKNNTQWVYLQVKTNTKIIKITGTTNILPKIGDYIECDKCNKNEYGAYDIKNFSPKLPILKKYQEERINDIIGYKLDSSIMKKIINKNIWLNIINKSVVELSTEDSDKLFNYVLAYDKNYKMEILKKQFLEMDCKITDIQLEGICEHKNFGPDISKWNKQELFYLFDIDGIGYTTVIKIADHLKLNEIEKAIIKIIKELDYSSDCHVYLLKNYKIFELPKQLFYECIEILKNNNKIYVMDKIIYSAKYLKKEMFIAQDLIKRQYKNITFEKSKYININKITNFLLNFRTHNNFQLDDEQKQGIINVFTNNVSIIIGKAGTGKSSILEGLTKCVEYINGDFNMMDLYFITPTAKAAIRIKEIIGNNYNAKTIHSFCNGLLNPKNIQMDVNILSDRSIIIIDESTMIDNDILYNLLSIIHMKGCKLLLIGDCRQLPSIGQGDVFNKIIQSKHFPITELVHVYRSSINLNNALDNILNKKVPELNGNDFIWIKPSNTSSIEKLLVDNVNIDPTLHIISMTNKFINDNTNDIREIINPKNEQNEYTYYNNIFREGDKVVHCKNDNEKELYNGMVGNIESINDSETVDKFIQVSYDNKKVNYDKTMISNLKLAYILTVHKSQGQEHDNVLVILENIFMANRNLLYTALSRAKKKVILIATEHILQEALKKSCPKRNSLLDLMFDIFKNENNIIDDENCFIDLFKKYYD
jgi:exodeoxyribonuclease V alpha subunit